MKKRKTVNRKRKKKSNNRLLWLLILLFLTSIMLGTSSYAWFTSNRIVSIDSLNVHVQAQGGIEISVDGSNWKTIVTQDDLENAISTYSGSINQLPAQLEPVSTGGVVSNGFLDMYYGITSNDAFGNYILSATKSYETLGNGADSDGKFMAFDLFFKVDNESVVYLTPESTVSYLGNRNDGSKNSIRFAFLDEGTVATGASISAIQSLRGGTSADLYIWEPNSDTHSATGISNANDVYGITVSASGSAPVPYSGIISPFKDDLNITLKDAVSSKYSTYFRTVDVDYYTSSNFNSNKEVWTFKAGITKMRIYIWIEGQDVDCENSSASGDLEFKFQLSTNPS